MIDSLEFFKLLPDAACTWQPGELLKRTYFGGFFYLNSHCKRKSIPFNVYTFLERDKFTLS